MKKVKGVRTAQNLLKWLTQTILVVGLITFCGNTSEFANHRAEPVKTELTELKNVSSKKTINFKSIVDASSGDRSADLTFALNFLLHHHENKVKITLNRHQDRFLTDDEKSFLVHHSNRSPEESHQSYS